MQKFYVSTLFIFISLFTFGQSWLEAHKDIDVGNKPSSTPLYQIIGTNIGYGIGDLGPYNGVIPHVRNFNLMENDYPKHLPKEGAPNANLCDASNAFCNAGSCQEILDPNSGKYGFLSKDWYFQWKNNIKFKETYASLEAIFPSENGNCSEQGGYRGYPNKFFTLEEMGGAQMPENIANYIKHFAETYCPDDPSRPCLVNVLEMGNEPWGDIPGPEAYKDFMRAVIEGMKLAYNTPNAVNGSSWRMKLGAPALEAYTTEPGCGYGDPNQYVENMLPADVRPFIDYLAVHNYAMGYENTVNGGLTECIISKSPESDTGVFLTMKNMVKWKDQKMPWAKVNITEFGWLSNSGEGVLTGEAGQNAYYMRAILLANRYDINKAFLYTLFDSEAESIFESTSFFDGGHTDLNSDRYSLKAVKKLAQSNLSDKKFLKALVEDNNSTNGTMAYLYGDDNGKPTHLVAWRAQEYNSPQNDFPATSGDYASIALPSSIEVAKGSEYFYLNWNNEHDASVVNNSSSAVKIDGNASHILGVKLSGMPVVIPLKNNSCNYDQNGTLVNCESCADPKPVGSACNDGDISTTDDVILADGCTCQGTVEPSDDCEVNETEYGSCDNNLIFKVSGRSVQIMTENHPDNLIVTVRNENWSFSEDLCNDYTGACSAGTKLEIPQNILDQNNGILILDIQNCGNIPIDFNGSTGNGADTDGDGICAANDCDDTNPAIPAPVGTACDDGDTTTINDVIQADGCSCAGSTEVITCQIELPQSCSPSLVCASVSGNTLAVDTNGNSLSRLDIHRDNYAYVESLCDNWGGTECSDVLSSSYLAPGNYLLRVPDANAPEGICWVPFEITSTQLAAKDHIKLYPNPTTSVINVDVPEGKKIIQISIFSLQGNKILEQKGDSRNVNVDILTKGVYLMRIDDENEVTTKRIIID